MNRTVFPSILVGLWVFVVACVPGDGPLDHDPVNLFNEGTGDRVVEQRTFDTLWTYYGGANDTVLASVHAIATLPGGDAVVLDEITNHVHRIGREGITWSWGPRGQGPGELSLPAAIAVSQQGEVVIGDSGNSRLVWVSPDGEWLRETSIVRPTGRRTASDLVGIAALGGEGYVSQWTVQEPWVHTSEDGTVAKPVAMPWQGFLTMHPMQTIGEIAGAANGRWAFGFKYGNGFFVFSGTESLGSYPYVEHTDFRRLVMQPLPGGNGVGISLDPPAPTRSFARDMEIVGDTLFILVGRRTLDRYSLDTGEYLGSLALPGTDVVIRVAMGPEVAHIVDVSEFFPRITALLPKGGL